MNDRTDFDRLAQSWLQDGPTEMPDRSLQAALDEVHVTTQRRFGAARRTFTMNGNAPRLAVAAVIGLLVLVGGGIYLSNNSWGDFGAQPPAGVAPTPTQTAIPSPAASVLGPVTARLESYGVVGRGVRSPEPSPASMTVTVPTGWTAIDGSVGRDGYAVEPNLTVWQINNRFNHGCTDHSLLRPAPGPSVAELIDALASQPGIQAGPITPVTIDGYSGQSVELTTATDNLTCGAGGQPGDEGFWLWASPDGEHWSPFAGEMQRIYAIDIDGTRFTFFARIPPGTTPEDLAALEGIIDSIDIEPAAAGVSPAP